jgi:hypothetical protein
MSEGLGYLGVFIAVTFFGSNFLPIKQYDTGDGIFFQFMLCTGIWMTGLFCNLIQGCPEFHAAASIGGMLWAIGNVNYIFSMKSIIIFQN